MIGVAVAAVPGAAINLAIRVGRLSESLTAPDRLRPAALALQGPLATRDLDDQSTTPDARGLAARAAVGRGQGQQWQR